VSTGLRRGELLALRWQDVDIEAGTLAVTANMARVTDGSYGMSDPKSRRSRRTVRVPHLGRSALLEQQARQEGAKAALGSVWQDKDRRVFTDELGRPWHPETFSSAWTALVKRTGLGPLRLHELRHTAPTLALAAGVPRHQQLTRLVKCKAMASSA
jgi:integrase